MENEDMENRNEYRVCHGCLSVGRNLFQLNNYIDLYLNLLGDANISEMKYFDVRFCWECIALLKKTQTFQYRIRNAHFMLHHQDFNQQLTINSLSTLSTLKKFYFNVTIENEEQKQKIDNINIDDISDNSCIIATSNEFKNNKINIINTSKEFNTVKTHVKSRIPLNAVVSIECSSKIFSNTSEGSVDNEAETNHIIKKEVKEEIEIHDNFEPDLFDRDTDDFFNNQPVHPVNKVQPKFKKKASVRKCLNMAETTPTNIDIKNVGKYFSEVSLSEEEIKNIQERCKMHTIHHQTKCDFCDCTFRSDTRLQNHVQEKHLKGTKYKCKQCKARFKSKSERNNHWMNSHKVFQCNLCMYVCQIQIQQLHHLRLKHMYNYTCKLCGSCYGNSREFSDHYNYTHERPSCDHCGKTFLSKKSIATHIRRHHTNLECKKCDKKFAKCDYLDKHIKLVHTEGPYFSSEVEKELAYCVECDRQFPSVRKYKRHLKTSAKHVKQKKLEIPCPECDKTFTRTNYRNNHYRLFHEKKNKHYCDICDKYYVSGFSLRKHKAQVHDKIPLPKNKICNMCGRGFVTNRILMHHIRTHTGERPHRCDYCTAAFSQKCALQTHVRARHKQIST